MKIELECTANDYYSYNYHTNDKYCGERSHFHTYVDKPGLFTFECDNDLPHLIIIAPNGRVIYKKIYVKNSIVKWNASIVGVYLFKLWTLNINDDNTIDSKDRYVDPYAYKQPLNFNERKYKIVFKGDGICKVEQQIYSGAMSNSDGSTFDKGIDVVRKNESKILNNSQKK
jgi:hypothetical protein